MRISDIIIEKETDTNITLSKDSWKKIQAILLQTEKKMDKARLQTFKGTIHLSIDPLVFQKNIRDEW